MPKTKKHKLHSEQRKGFITPIHIQAIIVLISYSVLSYIIFIASVHNFNIYISFFIPFLFGLISTVVFLYLFGHKDFFHFIGKFEKEEIGKERKYLHSFIRYGKLAACILVGAIGGPIFLALTIRFLFSESENRYWVAFITTLISTIFVVAFAKGLLSFIKLSI